MQEVLDDLTGAEIQARALSILQQGSPEPVVVADTTPSVVGADDVTRNFAVLEKRVDPTIVLGEPTQRVPVEPVDRTQRFGNWRDLIEESPTQVLPTNSGEKTQRIKSGRGIKHLLRRQHTHKPTMAEQIEGDESRTYERTVAALDDLMGSSAERYNPESYFSALFHGRLKQRKREKAGLSQA